MTTRILAVAALWALGACARPEAEPDVAVAERAAAPERSAALAQANTAKPLIHVWKSPT